jgi:hypothetical protein
MEASRVPDAPSPRRASLYNKAPIVNDDTASHDILDFKVTADAVEVCYQCSSQAPKQLKAPQADQVQAVFFCSELLL